MVNSDSMHGLYRVFLHSLDYVPSSVFVPENIREVYGVDTIINQDSGKPHIIPLTPCQSSPSAESVHKGVI